MSSKMKLVYLEGTGIYMIHRVTLSDEHIEIIIRALEMFSNDLFCKGDKATYERLKVISVLERFRRAQQRGRF